MHSTVSSTDEIKFKARLRFRMILRGQERYLVHYSSSRFFDFGPSLEKSESQAGRFLPIFRQFLLFCA